MSTHKRRANIEDCVLYVRVVADSDNFNQCTLHTLYMVHCNHIVQHPCYCAACSVSMFAPTNLLGGVGGVQQKERAKYMIDIPAAHLKCNLTAVTVGPLVCESACCVSSSAMDPASLCGYHVNESSYWPSASFRGICPRTACSRRHILVYF